MIHTYGKECSVKGCPNSREGDLSLDGTTLQGAKVVLHIPLCIQHGLMLATEVRHFTTVERVPS